MRTLQVYGHMNIRMTPQVWRVERVCNHSSRLSRNVAEKTSNGDCNQHNGSWVCGVKYVMQGTVPDHRHCQRAWRSYEFSVRTKNLDAHQIHEDNLGMLVLSKLEPPRMTPRIKHYAIKYHWFREQVCSPNLGIPLFKIDTLNQLGDIFTNSLSRTQLDFLRNKVMV